MFFGVLFVDYLVSTAQWFILAILSQVSLPIMNPNFGLLFLLRFCSFSKLFSSFLPRNLMKKEILKLNRYQLLPKIISKAILFLI